MVQNIKLLKHSDLLIFFNHNLISEQVKLIQINAVPACGRDDKFKIR